MQSLRPVRRVAELGSLGRLAHECHVSSDSVGCHRFRLGSHGVAKLAFGSVVLAETSAHRAARASGDFGPASGEGDFFLSATSSRGITRRRATVATEAAISFSVCSFCARSSAWLCEYRHCCIYSVTPMNRRPNHALQRTRRERRGCNRCVPCAGSLSLGR